MTATAIKIDVWSDIACPWCYIGKRKLEAGIAAFAAAPGSVPVDIEYHSFELSPDTPVDFNGSEIDYLVGAKGMPESQVRPMLEQVTGIAAGVGLNFDFGALQHTNTVKAHQIIHLAKTRGLQLEAVERLFRAYFVEGRHLGRDTELADLAADSGLEREDALTSLKSDEYLAAVRADQEQARAYGISGVPFFVIDGKYGISGAQNPETFTEVLTEIATERIIHN